MSVVSAVVSFAAVAGLLTIIPGLDTALVLRAAISNGRRHAFATAAGVNAGVLVWGAAAAVGISALLAVSTVAYTVVRLAGAVYMIWLGVGMLRAAVRRHSGPHLPTPQPATDTPTSVWRSGNRGLLTNLLNPKIGAFYVAVLPQFLPPHASHLAVGLLLAAVHDLEGLIWFTAIICTAAKARRWLSRPSAQRTVDAITGTTLVGFGLRLSLSST